jgi:ABC-type uncharacterized transport system involved in gliding motility auxiliary subunit
MSTPVTPDPAPAPSPAAAPPRSAPSWAVDLLAPLGLLVILAAYAWQVSGRPLPGRFEYYLSAGVFLCVLHAGLRWDAIVARIGRRQLAYGSNSALLTVLVLGMVVGVNWLASRHPKRWDLTTNKRYSLSEQSLKVIQGLQEDVRILYFQRKQDMAGAQDRMQLIQSASPRVKVEFVDPLSSPRRAEEYDARGPYPVLVLERGSRRERVTNDSEQDLTNALIKITRDQTKKVCFVEGEGERSLEDAEDRGFSAVKGALTRSQYQTGAVLLMREGQVPADCTVTVLAAPQKDLLPPVVEALRAYVRGGGKVLVMLEPPFQGEVPALNGLLGEWGFALSSDVVLDLSPVGQLFGAGPLSPVAAQYPHHEITKDLTGLATVFHTARSVKAASAPPAGASVQNLAETTRASWAETDLALTEPVRMDEGVDQPGPVALAAVATLPVTAAPSPAPTAASPGPGASPAPSLEPSPEPSPEAPRREARVVAIGDSDFATNAMLDVQGNRDFFLNVVSWLAEDADLISIRGREPEDQRLFLTEQQQRNVALFTLLLLPGAALVLGVVSWWRRR